MASSRTEGHAFGFERDARHPRGAGLLLFDLDDTIVQAGSHVSDGVLSAMSDARKAGYVLSIASGRPLCLVNKKILATGAMDYAVCANGASVTRLGDGSMIVHRPLRREDALDCYAMLTPFQPGWNAFLDDRAYFEWRGASYMITGRTGAVARTQRYARHEGGPLGSVARLAVRGMRYAWRMVSNGSQRQVRSLLPYLQNASHGVDKVGCTIPDAGDCTRAMRLLRDDGRFEVIRMSAHEVEITARGVTKGTGARALMDALGVGPEHAVAFGDGGNDLPLADAVGRFVAVGNADDEVKAAAADVCPPVDEDGVAVWIRKNLLS